MNEPEALDGIRIYLQLLPDEAAVKVLTAIGASLSPQRTGRLLPASELHITMIHFGKAQDMFEAIRGVTPIEDFEYVHRLKRYVERTKMLLTDDTYELSPLSYERFGARNGSLVITYTAPPELTRIHAAAVEVLKDFLDRCGVDDPARFMSTNPNLMHSVSFRPHVTLYKGYDGPDPATVPPPLTVGFMDVQYDARRAN